MLAIGVELRLCGEGGRQDRRAGVGVERACLERVVVLVVEVLVLVQGRSSDVSRIEMPRVVEVLVEVQRRGPEEG